MARHYRWNNPPAGGGGRGNIMQVVNENILSHRQRDFYEKFRAYQKREHELKEEIRQAVEEQQKALANLYSTGMAVKRIGEITQMSGQKVRDYIDHGRIHLGEEVPL